jgi:hypothetical protein
MSSYPNQISLNPKISLVKPNFDNSLSISTPEQYQKNPTGIDTQWKYTSKMHEWVVKEGNILYAKTLNIYLNYNFVTEMLAKHTKKNEVYLYKFLQDICNGINTSLGGIPNLEPIITDENTIIIQDQNKPRGIENSNNFSCRFTNESSFE